MRNLKFLLAVVCIFVLSLSGCAGNSDSDQKNAPDKEAVSVGEDQGEEKASKIPEAYVSLLEEYHEYILTYDPESDQGAGEIDDSKLAIWEMFIIQTTEEVLNSVGYAILDINGDEMPELLIGDLNSKGGNAETGGIFAVYTLVKGQPKLVLAGNARDQYFYLGKGKFANQSAGGYGYSLALFELAKGERTLKKLALYFSEEDASGEKIRYYYNEAGDYDSEGALELEREKFDSEVKEILAQIDGISYTAFSKYTADSGRRAGKVFPGAGDPLSFQNSDQVKEFLVGEWTLWHAPSSAEMAVLSIAEDASYRLTVHDPDHFEDYDSEGKIQILDHTKDENGVANTISFQTTKSEVPPDMKDRFAGEVPDGDYSITFKSLADGELWIELLQINNGSSYLLEKFGTPIHVFRKVSDRKQSSQAKKNAEFYAMCCKKDFTKKRVWLDTVRYDMKTKGLVQEAPMESLAYEFPGLQGSSPDIEVEYLFQAVRVKTDASGRIISYEEVEYERIP